ncbi:MAG TPA: hypothetical protein VFZ21_30865 [Gemmatimonadaceae bacterium]|nr:hypothetical protein [Gemmatimonadaceae bacterium]
MRPEVRRLWLDLNHPLEGRIQWMYCDILGKVTTGVGNLIDSPEAAAKFGWTYQDGVVALREDIAKEWQLVKSGRLPAREAETITALRLQDAAIDNAVFRQLAENERDIIERWGNWDKFPASAQMGILSMAWAMGSGFWRKFPKFSRAVDLQAWDEAGRECLIRSTGNPGVVPRNRANANLFAQAHAAMETIGRWK